MREILFRGQIRRKGEKVYMISGEPLPSRWCYGGIFAPHMDEKGFAVIYGTEGEKDEAITGTKLGKYAVYRDTVGQYTGLTDKNGSKIFEGDILKIVSTVKGKQIDNNIGICCGFESDRREDCAIVLPDYHTGGYRLKVIYKGKYKRISKFTSGHLSIYEAEIIGNIYDNPELLEARNADA